MKKINYNKGTFTILTTSTDGFEYSEYLDFCEDNDIEPGDENSDEFWEWCREEANINYEYDLEEIRRCKQYDVPVLVTGHLGLWDGKPEIAPVVFPNVYDAIVEMFARDIDDIEAKFVDGEIRVYAYHHDGCNCFTINALSTKGQRKAGYYYDKTYIDAKPSDVKRLPYLYAI